MADESRFLFGRGVYALVVERPYDALNMLAFLGALGMVWPVTRRLGLAAGLWIPINCLPSLAYGGWPSMGRYTSVLFPIFVCLGSMIPPDRAPLLIATLAMVQALVASLFFTFRPFF
jgi:hypothetical protein